MVSSNGMVGSADQQQLNSEYEEERWFTDRDGRDRKRPLRTSPTMPPPPIGDALADGWFR